MITPSILAACWPIATRAACLSHAPAIDAAATEFGADTPAKLAGALASLANESGQGQKTEESSYFNTPSPYITGLFMHAPDVVTLNAWKMLGKHEFDVRFFDAVYGPMMGNNGQGYKNRGLGLGQITGHDNNAQIGPLIGVDLAGNPELMRDDPMIGARAFFCYAKINGILDDFADGSEAGVMRGLRRMNPGLRVDVFRSHHLVRWHEVRLGLGIENDGRNDVRMQQAQLLIDGYDVGERDGWAGPKTLAALGQKAAA